MTLYSRRSHVGAAHNELSDVLLTGHRRVLLVSHYFWPEPGAASVRLGAVVRRMRARSWEVSVLTSVPTYPRGKAMKGYRPWRPTVSSWNGVSIYFCPLFPYGGRRNVLRLASQLSFVLTSLLGLFLSERPDMIIVESPPLPLVLSAAILARRFKAPLAMYCADLWPRVAIEMGALRNPLLRALALRLETTAYRLASVIAVPTDGLRAALERNACAGPGKVRLVPNGVDLDEFTPVVPRDAAAIRRELGDFGRRVLFAYVGTMGSAQGVGVIIQAARLLHGNREIGFLIIGDGPEKDLLERESSDLRLDNVRFVASVPPSDVGRYLALCRATIAPLRNLQVFNYTRPVKMLASLACGTPVIFCGGGEAAELLRSCEGGLVVPPEDSNALATAVRTLADDASLAAQLGRNGRLFVMRHFDFARLIDAWLDQLESVN